MGQEEYDRAGGWILREEVHSFSNVLDVSGCSQQIVSRFSMPCYILFLHFERLWTRNSYKSPTKCFHWLLPTSIDALKNHLIGMYHIFVWQHFCPRSQIIADVVNVDRTNQPLPIDSIYTSCCFGNAANIIKDHLYLLIPCTSLSHQKDDAKDWKCITQEWLLSCFYQTTEWSSHRIGCSSNLPTYLVADLALCYLHFLCNCNSNIIFYTLAYFSLHYRLHLCMVWLYSCIVRFDWIAHKQSLSLYLSTCENNKPIPSPCSYKANQTASY